MLNRFVKEKTIILLVFGSLISGICLAQQDAKIDSLLKVLKIQKDDTSKVNTLNALSRRFTQKEDYTTAVSYAEKALLIGNKITMADGHQGFKKGIGNAYNNLGNINFYQGKLTEALKYHYASLKPREEAKDSKGLIASYNNIGQIFWNLGNYPDTYKNYLAALKIRKAIGDKRGIALSYNVLGVIYDDEGNYQEALKNYLASLKIFEETGDKEGMIHPYNNIGEIYRKQYNYPEALMYYLKSLKICEEINNQGGIAVSYNNTGIVYGAQGNYSEAIKKFSESLKIYEELDDKNGIAGIYGNFGTIYYEQGKANNDSSLRVAIFYKSLKSMFDALKIFEEIDAREGKAESYTIIGKVYTELKKFSEARNYLNQGLVLSKTRGIKELVKDNYEALAKLDSETANWEGAYKNHNIYMLYRDSLLNKENTKKLTESKMQYEFDKKEDSLKYQQVLTDEKLKQQTLLSQQQQQTLLLKEKEFALVSSKQQLQQLQIEKDQADFAVQKVAQKAEDDKKQGQLVLLNKEKSIQGLELNKQKQVKKFLLAGLILFAILSFFIYRNYRNRQNVKLLMLRNKIASDLHDDVGSTLSSISIFSQMAQQQSKEVIPMLETIEESSRKMLDAMADIVWTINPENDHFEKIILRMRSFAYELLGAKRIDFEFIADEGVENMKLPMEVRKNLYLIFKEATNNMVKYAGANKVMFAIKGEKNILTMMIHDNGKGFDTNKTTEGNGLRNMKKRATEIGAELLIDSFPGNGTTIQLKVAV